MNETGGNCHISSGPLCLFKKYEEMDDGYKKAYRAFEDLRRSALYRDNPDFIKNTVHRIYWDGVESEDDEFGLGLWILISVSGLTIIISAVVLIVLFKCRSKTESSDDDQLMETT